MSFTGKISIILPIYNQEKYLDRILSSICNQTYHNFEVIAVNDGSTDRSVEILENYKVKDSRVKIYSKKNGGLVDATIFGVEKAEGDYISFIDPDDNIGVDYLINFVNLLDSESIDCIAMGFFYDDNEELFPFFLDADVTYQDDSLVKLRDNYIIGNDLEISNKIFVSRWNKLYSKKLITKVIKDFVKYKNITLGEDTIFTFLTLKYTSNIKTSTILNTYFYNISNLNSMTKDVDIDKFLNKSSAFYLSFYEMLNSENFNLNSAYHIYRIIVDDFFYRILKNENRDIFSDMYIKLKKFKFYNEMLKYSIKKTKSFKYKIELYLRLLVSNPNVYIKLFSILKGVKSNISFIIDMGSYFFKNCTHTNLLKLIRNIKFKYIRKEEFRSLKNKLPVLEEQIVPIIKEYYKNRENNIYNNELKKNIFIFWWDGFKNAPTIVQRCLASVKKHYAEYNIVEIDKYNFKEYCNISNYLLEGFYSNRISIQTFSDILRFNLLKENGGIWLDATILITKKIDLMDMLNTQSFNSIYFLTSQNFLEYKGIQCTWSGFFILSRKNGELVSVMDYIFEKYFIRYGHYPIYYFIDAALMICKLQGVDNSVLSQTRYIAGNMFALHRLLNYEYNPNLEYIIEKIPQKLAWNWRKTSDFESTFYDIYILNKSKRR